MANSNTRRRAVAHSGMPVRRFVEIPAQLEQALNQKVAGHLQAELGKRALLLSADQLQQATAEAALGGERLLTRVLEQCYPAMRTGGCNFEFESERGASRLKAALVFGAATARLLAPSRRKLEPTWALVEALCGVFNLGIGLVDTLCDEDPQTGRALLQLVQGLNLARGTEEPRGRGWLRATLPPKLALNHATAFAADIIESFFETLHMTYPGDAWLQKRRGVGAQLVAALAAEQGSVGSLKADRQRMIECSRLTSVIPFQIIESLARGDQVTEQKAGTFLGEAMWYIDDLIDLGQDARSGALNGVLLAAAEKAAVGGDAIATLCFLLSSTDIADAAALAAESLLAGLRPADPAEAAGAVEDHAPSLLFVSFIQRYAGLGPHAS